MISNNTRGYGGPARYIQGENEIDNIAKYTSIFGNSVYFVIDEFFYDDFAKRFLEMYHAKGMDGVYFYKFENQITEEKVKSVIKEVNDLNIDIIVGTGGGKALDLAKDAADLISGMPLIVIPTIASSDAPCSALSIIYNEAGHQTDVRFHKSNPDMVIVDSSIIAKAPSRFLVAGMGDGLATFFEARANIETNNPNYINVKFNGGYKSTLLGQATARLCYDTIMNDGIRAKDAVEAGMVNEALENVIEANILLSGIGFENTACAGAHSIGTGLGLVKSKKGMLHGEKVAFGVLCQLNLENRPTEEIENLMCFFSEVGLPLTLGDLGVNCDDETVKKITSGSFPENWASEPCVVTEEIVAGIIKYTDYVGNQFKNRIKV